MLDKENIELLNGIAEDRDTPAASRVSACALMYRLSAIPAKGILSILNDVINDYRTKSGIKVKALDLIDKINSTAGQEPELNSEDVDSVKTQLMEQFLVCPNADSKAS